MNWLTFLVLIKLLYMKAVLKRFFDRFVIVYHATFDQMMLVPMLALLNTDIAKPSLHQVQLTQVLSAEEIGETNIDNKGLVAGVVFWSGCY